MTVRKKPDVAGWIAGEDLTDKKYHFMKLDTSNEGKVLIAGADENVSGILNTENILDNHVGVSESGNELVKAGGTFSIGDELKSDANGKAIVASASNRYWAVAQKAAVLDDLVEVKIENGVA